MKTPSSALDHQPLHDDRLVHVCDQVLDDVKHSSFDLYPDLVTVHHLEPYKEYNGLWQKLHGKRLGIYHPLLAKISFLDEQEWALYDHFKNDGFSSAALENSEALENLLRSGLIIDKRKPWNVKISPQFDESDLYIKTTEGCNFSCKGCVTASDIIPPSKARTLDIEMAQMLLEHFVVSAIEKKMKRVNFKWAGGEPLLNNAFKIIAQCQAFVKKLREKYPQIIITQSLLTNGVYASSEKVDVLRANDIHISVSLWGTPDYQDKMRLPRNKIESFHRIIDHLKYMHECGVSYSSSFVITPDNAHDFADFISMIWDIQHPEFVGKEWKNPRPLEFNIGIFRPQHGQVYKPGEIETMENGLRAGFAKIRDMIVRGIPVPSMDRFDYLDLFNTIVVPCGSGYNYIAVGPEGANACHEGLFGMKSNMDRIRAGENMFDVVNEEYKPERNLLIGNNIKFEKDGNVLALHGGQGCPRLAKSESNGKLGTASKMSLIYAGIYEELICLEAMRQVAQGMDIEVIDHYAN